MCGRPWCSVLWIAVLVLAWSPLATGSETNERCASAMSFELPDNLPAVEAIHPLSDEAKARLQTNGFVILPNEDAEFLSDAYFNLFGETEVSVFITTDMALHLFHNVFDNLLAEVERTHLGDEVEELVLQLLAAADQRYATIPDGQPLGKAAARHDVVFLAVAARLLDPNVVVPDYVTTDVTDFVGKVIEHQVVEFYPGDDFTQYEPRGHYAGEDALESYFRAMKWLGRRIFRIEDLAYPQDADVELVGAVLLAQLMADDPALAASWQKVYDVTRMLAGTADSITPPMIGQAVDNVFGAGFTLDLLESPDNLAALRQELELDDYPESEIIPVPTLFPGQIPPKYVQLMGERYLPDADAMHHTCFPDVAGRTLPMGLDVMATVLASDRAEHWLAHDIAVYPGLSAQLAVLRESFDLYALADWTKSTYNGWLYGLRPLLAPMAAGAPEFMQSAAWQDKELNTALASWTQLRHDFILYGKQTYIPAPWSEGPGLVEPVPATFERLAALCEQVSATLDDFDMLPEDYDRALAYLEGLFNAWAGYAQTVADGGWLSDDDQGEIHRVGMTLLELFAYDWGIEEKSPALVADVASDSNTERVLHEGTGLFKPIIVVYDQPQGRPIAGIGYVFSHHEFIERNWNRLNDDEWLQRLSMNPPDFPEWVVPLLPAGWDVTPPRTGGRRYGVGGK
jgi:hypothetical protein